MQLGNRQEARPLEFRELTDSQKAGAERVAQSLLSALEDLEASSPMDDRTSGIDRFRPNQTFFVSGEPGSGKTALYLTLRSLLEDGRKEVDDEKDFPGLKGLRKKSHQLRWLEPLDLEPAAESANFLAAVLVRIAAEVEEKSPRWSRGQDRRPGLLEDRDALQDLHRLQSDIVLAWDGTVSQRAERIEPDIFAQEVLQAEKARLRVNRRLRDVLVRLSDKEEERVLYVLPVDDFYLKPASSLEFLRLLRMISVPQLFILVLGDLDVISDLFFQDLLGQLINLAGEGSLREIPEQGSVLTARAGALTSHAMRKLIPPSQRVVLQAMDKLQALGFQPQRPGQKEEERLERLLKGVDLDFDSSILPKSGDKRLSPRNFFDFLLLQETEDEAKFDFYTYSGLAILDLPPREAVDFWFSIASLKNLKEIGAKRWEKILGVVIDQTLEALDHQTYLDLESKERCREAIQGTPYHRRIFQRDVLRVEPRLGRGRPQSLGDGRVLTLSSHDAWILRPRLDDGGEKFLKNRKAGPRKQGQGGINYLAPRPTAWFTVLHDLMAMSSEDRMEGSPLLVQPFRLKWVVLSEKQSGRQLNWLTPAWPSFRHFDLLAFRWRKILDALATIEIMDDLLSCLSYHWLAAITEILKAGTWDPGRPEPAQTVVKEEWEGLENDTVSLLDAIDKPGPASGHYDVTRGWLLRLSLFLDSQFAIHPLAIKTLRNERLEKFWHAEREEIEAIRQSEVPTPEGEPTVVVRDFSSSDKPPSA